MNWKPADIAMVKALAGEGGGGGAGVTPNIQATAETLPAGSEATVTRTGSDANPVFNFGIPEGEPGKPGDPGQPGKNGEDGVTPDIQVGTVTTLEPGQNATVTRKSSSPDSAPVFDFGIPKGADGAPGAKGAPGKDATINGENAVTLAAGNNVTITTGEDGTVTISASGGGSSGGDVYSTEEQVIGTWINGKPLYRQIVVADIPSGAGQFSIGEEILNVDVVAEIRGSMLLNNDYWSEFPYVSGARDAFAVLQFNASVQKLSYWASTSIFTNATLYAEIKYTKTTDQATVELPEALTANKTNAAMNMIDGISAAEMLGDEMKYAVAATAALGDAEEV